LIVPVYAVSALPIPSKDPVHGWVGRPAFTYLIANEDGIFGYDVVAYLILTLIIALAAFAKRKWLPGGCLLVMNLWLLIPNIAYTISEDSLILEHTWNSNWYPIGCIILYIIAWFTIAWWMKKETVSDKMPGALSSQLS
jgi:hypothetical protein